MILHRYRTEIHLADVLIYCVDSLRYSVCAIHQLHGIRVELSNKRLVVRPLCLVTDEL